MIIEAYARVKMTKVRATTKTTPNRRLRWTPPSQVTSKQMFMQQLTRTKNQVGFEVVIRIEMDQ